MGRFIFGERNGIHIIDLQKTVKELKKVYAYVRDQAALGKRFLFVGTKKQAQDVLRVEAARCGAAYVADKWLGGTLTNFATIRKSVKRLEELEKFQKEGIFSVMPKKEVARLNKEMARLLKVLTGIRMLSKLPDLLFIIDPVEEELAVAEARRLKIPVVAVCDTDCDPDLIDHPIPGNDDAARSVKLFCGLIADAVAEGAALQASTQGATKAQDAEAVMLAGVEAAPAELPAEAIAQEPVAEVAGVEPAAVAEAPEDDAPKVEGMEETMEAWEKAEAETTGTAARLRKTKGKVVKPQRIGENVGGVDV
jgi:small subunit ribosomal protein S2